MSTALQQTITDLIADTLPGRRHRCYERIKRPPKNTFPTKKPEHIRPFSHVDYTVTVVEKSPLDQAVR